ncbi:MAG: hypothetical protein P4L84_07300, partial [Isosphaeraceae bacterium]|nr:hypothetical protein [Isosphaeraceae bacterium]
MRIRVNSQGGRGRGYGRRAAGMRRRHAGDDERGQDEDESRESFPVGVEEPEASQFDDELWGRPEEVVLVTRTKAESAALRQWGALAIARPQTGWWCSASLQVLEDRDVVFVDADAASQFGWAADDVEALAGVVGRVGLLVPEGCRGEAPPGDLAVFVERERQQNKGPEELVREAQARLTKLPEREPGAVADGDWPPLRRGERW